MTLIEAEWIEMGWFRVRTVESGWIYFENFDDLNAQYSWCPTFTSCVMDALIPGDDD